MATRRAIRNRGVEPAMSKTLGKSKVADRGPGVDSAKHRRRGCVGANGGLCRGRYRRR